MTAMAVRVLALQQQLRWGGEGVFWAGMMNGKEKEEKKQRKGPKQ